MALQAPNLDDRRFQDLVDEAKRRLQQRCEGWTDHNVSDPGVTLIELFAWMTDQLLYRLNRVPDRTFVAFLDLIGVELFPPAAAKADVTFWLSAPQETTIRVPAKSEVATKRTEVDEAIVFSTVKDLDIPSCSLAEVGLIPSGGRYADLEERVALGTGVECFSEPPVAGDALMVGLSAAVPSCAVLLRFDCETRGLGIDPRRPPFVWEAYDGSDWALCEWTDTTQGLNVPGDITVHVPDSHEESVVARRRAGWLRCVIVEPEEGQPVYTASPRIRRLSAVTMGGTVEAVHAEVVEGEVLGISEGVAGQRFLLKRTPVTPGDAPPVVEVSDGDGWQEWSMVTTFADSTAGDRHYELDHVTGEVRFGPAVRASDGTLVRYGAIPPAGATIRMRSYRVGGGRRGNVGASAVSVLKSSIPFVRTTVENRYPASGGVDGETLEDAKARGGIALRTANRAVTADDYEHLAREAAPEAARIRCVPANGDGEAGGVRVLVVPAATDEAGRIRFEHLTPEDETLAKIESYLDERRVVGSRLAVEYPYYQSITIVAQLRPRPGATAARLHAAALEALYRYFSPLTGGPQGRGWPFGRTVHIGDVYAVLQRVPGVDLIEEASLFAADPVAGTRGEEVQRIDLGRNDLVFSYDHQVLVDEDDVPQAAGSE